MYTTLQFNVAVKVYSLSLFLSLSLSLLLSLSRPSNDTHAILVSTTYSNVGNFIILLPGCVAVFHIRIGGIPRQINYFFYKLLDVSHNLPDVSSS